MHGTIKPADEEARERCAESLDARLYVLKPSSAPPATLLVSPRGSFVTGTTIQVDGGSRGSLL